MEKKSIKEIVSTVMKSFTLVMGFVAVLTGIFLTGCTLLKDVELTYWRSIIDYILEEKPDVIISVGIWDDRKEDKCVYTLEGKKNYQVYQYQIGSITKTFTEAMIANQEQHGHLKLSDGNLPLEKLAIHKRGLSDLWEKAFPENLDIIFTKNVRKAHSFRCGMDRTNIFQSGRF